MQVLIIDLKISNLGSIKRALEYCGAQVIVSQNFKDLQHADKIVLPGVGTFRDAMNNLIDGNWIDQLKEHVLVKRLPLLGICLGMQLLATTGFECGEHSGLGFIPGKVIRLESVCNERVPHVGWNTVAFRPDDLLFSGVSFGTDFYFVHSYHFIADNINTISSKTPYCGEFVSSVKKNNIFGTQFHPEKSSTAGFTILKNFLSI
jgi:glutamine amidotransferase